MAKPRLTLQDLLEALLGSPNVYFQPGEDAQMNYPCIVYGRDDASVNHADNLVYNWAQRYQLTYIDRIPDSDVIDKLVALPLCAFQRHFATSGLNHDVFVIYH
jgi:hypothetical protein